MIAMGGLVQYFLHSDVETNYALAVTSASIDGRPSAELHMGADRHRAASSSSGNKDQAPLAGGKNVVPAFSAPCIDPHGGPPQTNIRPCRQRLAMRRRPSPAVVAPCWPAATRMTPPSTDY